MISLFASVRKIPNPKLPLDKCRSAEFARTRPASHQRGPDKPLQNRFLQCPVGCQSFFKVDAIFPDFAE